MKVSRNQFGDIQWIINNEIVAQLFNGRKSYYSNDVERGLVGYTIIYKNTMGTTSVHLMSLDEALDTINNVIEKYDEIIEQSKRIGKYLSSDEGAWGR